MFVQRQHNLRSTSVVIQGLEEPGDNNEGNFEGTDGSGHEFGVSDHDENEAGDEDAKVVVLLQSRNNLVRAFDELFARNLRQSQDWFTFTMINRNRLTIQHNVQCKKIHFCINKYFSFEIKLHVAYFSTFKVL